MADDNGSSSGSGGMRNQIAFLVLGISAVLLVVISVVMVRCANDPGRASESVFNALLPLVGTWVGTVLAFYFSRENFEAANKSVQKMVELTAEQKLKTLKVIDHMIPRKNINGFVIDEGKTDESVLITDLNAKAQEVTRVPIFTHTGVIRYIVHRSLLYQFLAKEYVKQGSTELPDLKLADFLKADKNTAMVKDSLAFVGSSATVADAKNLMEQTANCQDVFVTKSGGATEEVLGWLTNVDISKLAKA